VGGSCFVVCGWGKTAATGARAYREGRRRFVVGCSIAFVGAIAWILTENLCDRPDTVGRFFRWFPGHFVWHSTMAFGMNQALLFAAVLRASNFRTRVYVYTGNWYFWVLPSIKYDSAGGIVAPTELTSLTPPGSARDLLGMRAGDTRRVAPAEQLVGADGRADEDETDEVEEFVISPQKAAEAQARAQEGFNTDAVGAARKGGGFAKGEDV
jgi:hypothetical protein